MLNVSRKQAKIKIKEKNKNKKKKKEGDRYTTFIYHTTLLKMSVGFIQPPSRVCVPWLPFVAPLFWFVSTFTIHSDHGNTIIYNVVILYPALFSIK